eukprot:1045184-Pleurochrysis_carterae.AAC.1
MHHLLAETCCRIISCLFGLRSVLWFLLRCLILSKNVAIARMPTLNTKHSNAHQIASRTALPKNGLRACIYAMAFLQHNKA